MELKKSMARKRKLKSEFEKHKPLPKFPLPVKSIRTTIDDQPYFILKIPAMLPYRDVIKFVNHVWSSSGIRNQNKKGAKYVIDREELEIQKARDNYSRKKREDNKNNKRPSRTRKSAEAHAWIKRQFKIICRNRKNRKVKKSEAALVIFQEMEKRRSEADINLESPPLTYEVSTIARILSEK